MLCKRLYPDTTADIEAVDRGESPENCAYVESADRSVGSWALLVTAP
jgi:hypothetical protein